MSTKTSPFKKFNPVYINILPALILTAVILFLLSNLYFVDSKKAKELPIEGFQKIFSPPISAKLDFAGEIVPQENFEVFERIEREILVNTYWHSFTLLAIKRANRWFPVIEPILKKNNIPEDFKYVSVIESGLTNAVSPSGATGFWQMLESVGKKYGLEVNDEVDERYDVEKSTEAACLYLKEAFGQFKNWTLSAASFNMGMNGVEKQLERQKTNNYYNLVLNEETSRYIARIIALKEILKDPKKYGYYLSNDQLYKPLKSYSVEVTTGIHNIADFAAKYEVNYKTIKTYNPWLREMALADRNHKIYFIKIPEKGSISLIK